MVRGGRPRWRVTYVTGRGRRRNGTPSKGGFRNLQVAGGCWSGEWRLELRFCVGGLGVGCPLCSSYQKKFEGLGQLLWATRGSRLGLIGPSNVGVPRSKWEWRGGSERRPRRFVVLVFGRRTAGERKSALGGPAGTAKPSEIRVSESSDWLLTPSPSLDRSFVWR